MITTQWTSLDDGGEAYQAKPADREPLGTVIVCMEIYGVDEHIRDICRRLADEGYEAIAPDFYWRQGPRRSFAYGDGGREAAMASMRSLDRDEVLADVAAARAHGHGGRLAILGFSLGGHIALLAATDMHFELAMDFYGGWTIDGGVPLAAPEPPLAIAAAIAAHGTAVVGFVGEDDHLVPPEQWQRIGRKLTDYGVRHQMISYAGVGHGFFNDARPEGYDAKAADDAWARVLAALGSRPH